MEHMSQGQSMMTWKGIPLFCRQLQFRAFFLIATTLPRLRHAKCRTERVKKELSSTVWLVDEDEDEQDYEGVAVATASTPPVTGPVKVP